MASAIERLITEIKRKENPTCVGFDTTLELVPEEIVWRYRNTHRDIEGLTACLLEYNIKMIDILKEIVPAIKVNISCYEKYGAPGLTCYTETINAIQNAGMIAIGDVKRADVTHTSSHYSEGHIGRPLVWEERIPIMDVDFMTVNPYFGTDSIEPFIDDCINYGKGIVVLVKTSNPSSSDFQDLLVRKASSETYQRPLYEEVCARVSRWGEGLMSDKFHFSSVCAVVGATHPEQLIKLRKLFPKVFFLIPGYGAQGGGVDDILPAFRDDGLGGIVNSARGIIGAHKMKEYNTVHYSDAIYLAALKMKDEINNGLKDRI